MNKIESYKKYLQESTIELVTTIYKDHKPGYSLCYDYAPLIKSLGDVIIQHDTDDYQGDTLVLYDYGNDNYGYLCFGWGSCSGCDALQDCETYQEVAKLRDKLKSSITMFDSRQACLNFMKHHDWEGGFLKKNDVNAFLKLVYEFFNV